MPADLVRVLRWLRNHPDDPVRLENLATVAGVRPRTLETHFKRFLGAGPIAWTRGMRLAKLRRELLAASADATVTGVALANGFHALGRMAGAYHSKFGETPSDTLRRRRTMAGGTDSIDDEAERLTWRAFPAAYAVAPRENATALADLDRAQALAPNFGLAKAMAAWCWGQRAAQHFGATPADDLRRAGELAAAACTIAPDDALTLTLSAGALALAHRVEEADRLIERALALDPWSAVAWARRGWCSAYLGDGEGAVHAFRTALQFAPFEPLRHVILIGIGCAHFGADRFDRAIAWTRSGIDAFPQSFWALRIVAAAAVHAGANAEARRITRRLMRKDPDLSVRVAVRAWPFPPPFMDRLADGLRRAGLPAD